MAENKKTETFASIFGDEADDFIESKKKDKDGTTTLNINDLIPFENHPFKLYEGARLDDMVDSIKNYGIILPIVVRKKDNQYQILSGHNRVNSAKIVGLTEVPAIIKENLTEEATLIVTETNLMQRSFTDLTHSERVTVIATRHNAMKSQGVKTDLLNEIEQLSKARNLAADETSRPMGKKLNSDKNLAKEYGISPRNISRYLRNRNIPEIITLTPLNLRNDDLRY